MVVRFWGKAGLHTHGAGEERLLSLSEQAGMALLQNVYAKRVSQGVSSAHFGSQTQWAQFPAMLAINPVGPVPIPLYWAALPLPHPNHTHCLAVTVSLSSRDLPATLESEGSHKTLSTSH